MKSYFCIILSLIFLEAESQVIIRGHVRDKASKLGVPNASVTAANQELTSFYTDQNGYFELQLKPGISIGQTIRLLITAQNYKSWNTTEIVSAMPIENIYLISNLKRPPPRPPQPPRDRYKKDSFSVVHPSHKKFTLVADKVFYINSTFQTQLDVSIGDSLVVLVKGFISLSEQYPHVNSSGLKSSDGSLERKFNIAPNLNYGALIERIGDAAWAPCGYVRSGKAAHEGKLWFAVNDNDLGDNDGYFEVAVRQYRKQ